MYKKDQKKGIIAIILFGSIALSYFIFDKEIAKIVALVAFAIWLLSMYLLNKNEN